jgi:hypothetical protein
MRATACLTDKLRHVGQALRRFRAASVRFVQRCSARHHDSCILGELRHVMRG